MVDLGQKKVNRCSPFFMPQILGCRTKRVFKSATNMVGEAFLNPQE